jgi:hypothetical protein
MTNTIHNTVKKTFRTIVLPPLLVSSDSLDNQHESKVPAKFFQLEGAEKFLQPSFFAPLKQCPKHGRIASYGAITKN